MKTGKVTGIDVARDGAGKDYAVITVRHGEPPKPKKGKNGEHAPMVSTYELESRVRVPLEYAKTCAIGDEVRIELIKEGRPGREALKAAMAAQGRKSKQSSEASASDQY